MPGQAKGARAFLRRLVVVLGVPVDMLDMGETLDRLEALIQAGRTNRTGHQVATANADFVVNALRDPELCKLLQNADLTTADGMPLVWGARLLGAPLRERVTGADLVPALIERAAKNDYTIYLLGAAPGVAARAAEILCQRFPGLRIVGIQSPNLRSIEDTDPALLEDIRRAKPDVLMVALGNPKQEKWIGRFGAQITVPVMMGIGGSLDFIAGKTRRAPRWMQMSGLEWVYRLLQEPRRLWQRYAVDLFLFSGAFLRQLWAMRPGWQTFASSFRSPGPITIERTLKPWPGGELVVVNIPHKLTAQNLEEFRAQARSALEHSPYLAVNLTETSYLDSTAIGSLVAIAHHLREAGCRLWLIGPQPGVRKVLAHLRLESLFDIEASLSDCQAAAFYPHTTTQAENEHNPVLAAAQHQSQ